MGYDEELNKMDLRHSWVSGGRVYCGWRGLSRLSTVQK